MRRSFIVLLNEKAGAASAGGDELQPAALRAAFAKHGIEADVQALAPDKLGAALRNAVTARPDAVVIGGGDGTVRSAAAILAGSGLPLGVLPLGTLNHFAKDLKMPAAADEAVAALADGTVRPVDIGEVNGEIFINNCSLGSYAEAVRRRDALRATHGFGKWRAMLRASLQIFLRLRRLRLRVTVDGGEPRAFRTPLVVIANNRYSGHVLDTSMRERLDEGRVWMYTAHVHHHLAALRLAWQSLVRRLDAADALASEAAVEIVIENTGGPLPVAMDGEPVELAAPLHVRCRPGALHVLAPSEAGAEKTPSR